MGKVAPLRAFTPSERTSPPPCGHVLAARLCHALGGRSWRPVLLGLVATIGERTVPGPPAAGTEARDRWQERRKGEELKKLDVVRVLRPGGRDDAMHEATTPRERRAERDRRDKRIRELDARGESMAAIARVMKCSRSTVGRVLGRMRTR